MNATGGQTEYPQYAASLPGYGSAWKKEVKSRYVAQARVWIAGGEMLARKENFVELDPEVKDHWGIPVLKIHFTHSDNDRKIMADFQHGRRAVPQSGRRNDGRHGRARPRWDFPGGPALRTRRRPRRRAANASTARDTLGGSIHEVGTARMSRIPRKAC